MAYCPSHDGHLVPGDFFVQIRLQCTTLSGDRLSDRVDPHLLYTAEVDQNAIIARYRGVYRVPPALYRQVYSVVVSILHYSCYALDIY